MKKSYKLVILFISLFLFYFSLKVWENVFSEKTQIEKDLRVIIYTKNNCRYCILAKKLLDDNNLEYDIIDITDSADIQKKLINQTTQTTVPYIFINDKFIGGYTDLLKLQNDGGF